MKKTIIDLFESSVEKFGDKDFLLEKHDGVFQPTTYKECKVLAKQIGAGLVAMGVKPKQTVSILAEGCNNWILSELGLLYAGAISVPLSIKLEEANDLLFRLRHADVEMIFVSQYQLSKIRKIREQLPLLKQIIIFDGDMELQEGEVMLKDVMTLGEKYLSENEAEFLKIGQAIQNDDYATITYTSGTTADPKGVILTHRNYTANVEQALTRISIPSDYKMFIILPLDHCFAHVAGFYIMVACGASVATTQVGRTPMETLKNVPVNIKEVKPHVLLSVPALAKNFRKSIETSIRKQGPKVEKLFKFALKVAYEYNQDGYTKGKGWRFILKPLVSLFDKILFEKVRAGFGGNIKFFVGGGALLDSELQRFFYAVGMPMLQGYGLSEATPIISANSLGKGRHRFGSSGMVIQPLEIKILDDEGREMPCGVKGEIVIKGENVMAGYWKNPSATAETVKDGWLYTGDMGYMGEDGFLYVLGRFKSLLIAADVDKYSPEGMEEAIVDKSPLIDQIIFHNNQSPFTSAIVVPNRDAIRKMVTNAEDEAQLKAAATALMGEIDKYRKGGQYADEFPDRWLPGAIAIVDEAFTEQNGLVNSTMKVVRAKVEEYFADRIEDLYTGEGKHPTSAKNLASIKKLVK